MTICLNCGSATTLKGRPLEGRYCSPKCLNEARTKSPIIIGFDFGHDEWATECVARVNDDGTMTVLELNRWRPRHDIDLKAEESR